MLPPPPPEEPPPPPPALGAATSLPLPKADFNSDKPKVIAPLVLASACSNSR